MSIAYFQTDKAAHWPCYTNIIKNQLLKEKIEEREGGYTNFTAMPVHNEMLT